MVLLDEMEAQHEEAQNGSGVNGGGRRRNSLAQPGGGGKAQGDTVTYINEGASD